MQTKPISNTVQPDGTNTLTGCKYEPDWLFKAPDGSRIRYDAKQHRLIHVGFVPDGLVNTAKRMLAQRHLIVSDEIAQ